MNRQREYSLRNQCLKAGRHFITEGESKCRVYLRMWSQGCCGGGWGVAPRVQGWVWKTFMCDEYRRQEMGVRGQACPRPGSRELRAVDQGLRWGFMPLCLFPRCPCGYQPWRWGGISAKLFQRAHMNQTGRNICLAAFRSEFNSWSEAVKTHINVSIF